VGREGRSSLPRTSVRFRSQDLVHNVARVWTAEGQTIAVNSVSVRYLRSLKFSLNVRCTCGHQVLGMMDFEDTTFTEEMLTCLACLVSPS
jgi:hypothetical protein